MKEATRIVKPEQRRARRIAVDPRPPGLREEYVSGRNINEDDQTSKLDEVVAAAGLSRRRLVYGAASAAGTMVLAHSSIRAMAQPARQKAFWPNGARLAIAFSMVVETGADPDPIARSPDGKAYPDLYAKTAELYAAREAIPRMLDMFDRRRIKVTAILCGLSCERYPELAKDIAQRGHECASHGRSHDFQYQLPRDAERTFIKESADMIEKATGQRPVGYNCRA
jgi:hypothetical protein